MALEMEKELSMKMRHALKDGNLDDVIYTWSDYYGYIRNLDVLNQPYDLNRYNSNMEKYNEWRTKHFQEM